MQFLTTLEVAVSINVRSHETQKCCLLIDAVFLREILTHTYKIFYKMPNKLPHFTDAISMSLEILKQSYNVANYAITADPIHSKFGQFHKTKLS